MSVVCLGFTTLSCAQEATLRKAAQSIQLVQSIPIETSNLSEPEMVNASTTWLEMIQGAHLSIDTAQMYVSSEKNQTLEPILQALEQAGRRGVKVRVLLSAQMAAQDQASYTRLKKIPGAEVRNLDLSRLTQGILHAKYWIIDQKEVFVGSQNLDWKALSEIHELGVRIQNKSVATRLQTIFDSDWTVTQTGTLPVKADPSLVPQASDIEVVASPPALNPAGIPEALPALLALIGKAKSSLRIQLLNYSLNDSHGPTGRWTEIDQALRAAAKKGVTVELLVSHWNLRNSKDVADLKALDHEANIEVRIATIPEGSAGPIPYARVVHSKYMLVDDQILWLGTSNWSRNYFYGSRNVDLIIHKPQETQIVRSFSDRLWESPYTTSLPRGN